MKYLICLISLNFLFSITGLELATLMEDRSKPLDIKSNSIMELVKKNGRKKTLKLINKSKDNSKKQMIWFLEPKDDYGISFLKIEQAKEADFMNMWLPGFKKFRRISSQKKSDSFMGSDLSFEDMTNRDLDEYEFEILEDSTTCYESTSEVCYKLLSKPKYEFSEYSKHISWVTKNNFLAIKEESYNKKNEKFKIKTLKYEKIENYFVMNELFVKNILKNTSTLLNIEKISINNGYSDDLFHSKSLKRIPLD